MKFSSDFRRKALLLALILLISGIIYAGAMLVPTVVRAGCVGCGDCTKACPTDAISISRGKAVIDASVCINCNICVKTCPYQAIKAAR